jgi:hypothetical protein
VPCSAASASRRRRNHIVSRTGDALQASFNFVWLIFSTIQHHSVLINKMKGVRHEIEPTLWSKNGHCRGIDWRRRVGKSGSRAECRATE